ncbi:MAG: Sulfotransferase domain protein [Bacteroidetes bacterium]|nr:Sulfotransferase domain protein [Bacteroidota bacterium]
MNALIERIKLHTITVPVHRLRWLFSKEAKLLRKKGKLPDEGTGHSVYIFSTHKCASTFLNVLIKDLSQREQKTHIDMEGYLTTRPEVRDSLYLDEKFTTELLNRKGFYFGVFRYPFEKLAVRPEQKIILVLRDPRDILTSQFFSIAYSHPVYTDKFMQKRAHALEAGIDQHVMDMSDRFLKTYTGYLQKYIGQPNVLLILYEDLISNFQESLLKMLHFIDYSKKEETLKYWEANNPFIPQTEDIQRHKRKMLPGDHKEKLQEKTIAELNKKFAAILSTLGYTSL